jgi:hypothetical protein
LKPTACSKRHNRLVGNTLRKSFTAIETSSPSTPQCYEETNKKGSKDKSILDSVTKIHPTLPVSNVISPPDFE